MNARGTQRERLLHLLEENCGEWVPLPRILALGIAQYGARILELRRELRPRGYRIENRTRRVGGVVYSSYRLVPPASQGNLFGPSADSSHDETVRVQ
jgi:hypothetical protein